MSRFLASPLALSLILSPALAYNALIVQNKGGGHGELGYHLSQKLLTSGASSVTLLQDTACKSASEPYCSYSSLPDAVKVSYHDFTTPWSPSDSYDYVWDNYSSDPTSPMTSSLIEHFTSNPCKRYSYVSSAGIYSPPPGFGGDDCGPLLESFPVLADKGQAAVEAALEASSFPALAFRPQYIYGPNANKFSYIDYFLDRIEAGKPVPIPGSGNQLVSLTNAKDVATLLSHAPNCSKDWAVYNCGGPVYSYSSVASMCGSALGRSADVRVGSGKGAFPFRPNNFHVLPTLAAEELGYKGPEIGLEDDLGWYVEDWRGRGGSGVDEKKDEEALAVTK